MREILFKAKRRNNGEWVDGFFVRQFGANRIYLNGSDSENIYYDVDPETVVQYTGLTDINDNKIFDGDIIKHYNDELNPHKFVLSIVKWDCLESKFYKTNIGDCTNWAISASCKYEVIGNIHDNTELLNGQAIDWS